MYPLIRVCTSAGPAHNIVRGWSLLCRAQKLGEQSKGPLSKVLQDILALCRILLRAGVITGECFQVRFRQDAGKGGISEQREGFLCRVW